MNRDRIRLYQPKDPRCKDWGKGNHLFTHVLQEDRFDFGSYPSRRMLNQNLGGHTRLLRLQRYHRDGEFLLNTEGYHTFLFPGQSMMVIRDARLRTYRIVNAERYMLLAPGNYLVRGVAYSGPVWGSYLVRFRKEDIRTWADAGLIAPFEFNLPSQAQPTRMLRTYRQGCMFDPHFQMGFFLSFHLCCAPDANLLGYLRDYVMAGEPLPVSEGVTPDIDEQMYFWDFLRNVAERKRIKGLVPQMNPKEMMRVVRCENIAELMRHSPCPTATVEELIS